MKYRELGRTGLRVSEVGFGAWGIGQSQWVGADDDLSLRALKAAFDAGVNFYDTALAYGDGHSEQLIGRAFGKSSDVIIASKVPPKDRIWPAQEGASLRDVFPKKYVLDSLHATLKNLGREAVDVYQFHVWNDEWADQAEWQDTVTAIRRSGMARFVGISINDHQPANSLGALETGLIDTVQVIYNIFDQSPADALFPYCLKHNIGVIVRVPFDEGSLTGKIRPETDFPAGDFRAVYFAGERKQEVWERVQRIANDTGFSLESLPELALRFCISHPAVSTVIPGMRNPNHARTNAAYSDAGPLPSSTSEKVKAHRWERNFYS